jgi:hypothetical protein
MAFNLPCFIAIFFKLFIFQQSIFQRLYVLTEANFNMHMFQLQFFVHEGGKFAMQYYIVCMPCVHGRFALPGHLCFSYCLTRVYHMLIQQNTISHVYIYTHVIVQLNSIPLKHKNY